MKFSPQFLDEIRARASLEGVVGRRVKLVRRGRELTGLCPFHQEKTPSFTVSDQKGFFHCFGCGAHGDVIGFVMRTEGLSFPEAVERLASEAGLELPRETPAERQRHETAVTLGGVLEAAAVFFEEQLKSEGGRAARDYLQGRALSAETIARFRLGFAPPARGALKSALAKQGIDEAQMMAAGLIIEPEGGAERYDRFRGRVMFPIRDARGRVVAFGGRILGPGEPKYLNSPETELFHKGAMLYGLDLAAAAARKVNRLIVVEGYMDVIALSQAGIAEAVAPLGTALTEMQLELLWRYAAQPMLCFDGDAAGQRAASRAVERALSRVKAGFSLRFATLPTGDDPDSLIGRGGRIAMEQVLDAAVPFSTALWKLAAGGLSLETPEARAEVGRRLDSLVEQIPDRDLRFHYQRHFRQQLNDSAFSARRIKGKRGNFKPGRSDDRAREQKAPLPNAVDATRQRERTILQTVVNFPDLLTEFGDEIALLEIKTLRYQSLRDVVVSLPHEICQDRAALIAALGARGLDDVAEDLFGDGARYLDWAASPLKGVDAVAARVQLRQALDLHHRATDLEQVRAGAERALRDDISEENMNRLVGVLHAIEDAPGLEDAVLGYQIPPGRRRP
ncbi:MAG: DNA primase [Alphaproteobacteria bacterium]|nr:DNA primase [Alphaproteobacteria bacterium]